MAELVRVERHGAVLLWTICREQRRNAIDPDVVSALEAALEQARTTADVRAVVLTGEGQRAFVSGADLAFLVSTADPAGARTTERDAFNARMRAVLDGLARLPVPVIAAIQGFVMGGGCEVAVTCDLRIADETASFTFKHGAMGVCPGWGGLARLCSLVPRGVASHLLLTGEPLDAASALRAGLVDELVPKGEAVERALELGQAISKLSPRAVAEMKWLVTMAYGEGGPHAERERLAFARRGHSADHLEALTAHADRRRPAFAPRATELLRLTDGEDEPIR